MGFNLLEGSHDYKVSVEDIKNSIKNFSNNGILVMNDPYLYTDKNLAVKGSEIFKEHPRP